MKINPRLIIFVLVILAVGVIFVVPYLNGVPDKFATTDQPADKLQEAIQQGRPVFLEFYAKW